MRLLSIKSYKLINILTEFLHSLFANNIIFVHSTGSNAENIIK